MFFFVNHKDLAYLRQQSKVIGVRCSNRWRLHTSHIPALCKQVLVSQFWPILSLRPDHFVQ